MLHILHDHWACLLLPFKVLKYSLQTFNTKIIQNNVNGNNDWSFCICIEFIFFRIIVWIGIILKSKTTTKTYMYFRCACFVSFFLHGISGIFCAILGLPKSITRQRYSIIETYIYIICTFKMNTRPIHLHMSVCFEERSIEQYLLFLFITCKWSGRVFYTRFNETVHLSKTAYRLTACRRSGSRSVRGCGTFDTLVCIEIPQSCLRRSHDLWEET